MHISSENQVPEKEETAKKPRARERVSSLVSRASSIVPADIMRAVDSRSSSSKGMKRKRSAASTASDTSAKASKRLSGVTSRALKKQRTSVTPSSNESVDTSSQMIQQEPEHASPSAADEQDIHGALRVGGKRLVIYSLDTDGTLDGVYGVGGLITHRRFIRR